MIKVDSIARLLGEAATTIAAEKATVAKVRRAMVTATGNRCGHVVTCEASVLSPFHKLRLGTSTTTRTATRWWMSEGSRW